MKKLVLMLGIVASVVSVGISAMSDEEWNRAFDNCADEYTSACQALIDNGLQSVEQCTKETCNTIGVIYNNAGYPQIAFLYYEKAVSLGDILANMNLGIAYDKKRDFYNAAKHHNIACEKLDTSELEFKAQSCFNLGVAYNQGKGVRQDYHKAAELYKKSCDMKFAQACHNLSILYFNGQGVRQNNSTAKEYFGKACDLGIQDSCDNYKLLNNKGVQ